MASFITLLKPFADVHSLVEDLWYDENRGFNVRLIIFIAFGDLHVLTAFSFQPAWLLVNRAKKYIYKSGFTQRYAVQSSKSYVLFARILWQKPMYEKLLSKEANP